jgi:hypothetical protein
VSKILSGHWSKNREHLWSALGTFSQKYRTSKTSKEVFPIERDCTKLSAKLVCDAAPTRGRGEGGRHTDFRGSIQVKTKLEKVLQRTQLSPARSQGAKLSEKFHYFLGNSSQIKKMI